MPDLVPVYSVPATYEEFIAQDDSVVNKLTGQGGEGGNYLPRLSINYDAEFLSDTDKNANPIALPRGTWKLPVFIEEAGVTVAIFAKEATFRPFVQTYRYSVYDAEENKNILTTTPFNDWGQPIVDVEGNEFKAGQYKKKLILKHPEYSDKLKCERYLYGLTTISGKDMHGKEREVVDVPSVWRTRGSGFMPVAEAIDSLNKEKKKMYMWPMHLTTKREKNGNVTYFTPVIEFKDEVQFVKEEFDLFRSFAALIKAETELVVKEYKKVITKKKGDNFAAEFARGSLNDDLDDEFFGGTKVA